MGGSKSGCERLGHRPPRGQPGGQGPHPRGPVCLRSQSRASGQCCTGSGSADRDSGSVKTACIPNRASAEPLTAHAGPRPHQQSAQRVTVARRAGSRDDTKGLCDGAGGGGHDPGPSPGVGDTSPHSPRPWALGSVLQLPLCPSLWAWSLLENAPSSIRRCLVGSRPAQHLKVKQTGPKDATAGPRAQRRRSWGADGGARKRWRCRTGARAVTVSGGKPQA